MFAKSLEKLIGERISKMKRTVAKKKKGTEKEGSFAKGRVSTGSTLLDLAISGTRIRGGGLPAGILVEAFGPHGSGKTVLLCQIAGNIQKQGGSILFRDPEARLNEQFSKMFGFSIDESTEYSTPDTVIEAFKPIRKWEPETELNGVFIDSLAALSTEMEMADKEGFGTRRAKEFSEELRKVCRVIAKKGYLIVASNQIRENIGAGLYGEKYLAPGGKAMGFYSSVRLRFSNPEKIKVEKTIHGKAVKRTIGIKSTVEVCKNSVDKPYRSAPLTIIFDYGIDDIRDSLQYLKTTLGLKSYAIGKRDLSKGIEKAIQIVEEKNLEEELRDAVIDAWESVEAQFSQKRKVRE